MSLKRPRANCRGSSRFESTVHTFLKLEQQAQNVRFFQATFMAGYWAVSVAQTRLVVSSVTSVSSSHCLQTRLDID